MDKMDYKEFMEKNDLKVEGNLAYGNVKGYPLLVRKKNGKRCGVIFLFRG